MTVRLSEFAPNIHSERELLTLVNEGSLDQSVLDIVLPHGVPREYETALWDYKRKLPNTLGKPVDGADEPSEVQICELVKDVVSFYNSFGGYIVAGVGEFNNEPIYGCKNC